MTSFTLYVGKKNKNCIKLFCILYKTKDKRFKPVFEESEQMSLKISTVLRGYSSKLMACINMVHNDM